MQRADQHDAYHCRPIIPTLRLLHKYPNLLPRMQVDQGAIKFVLSGANVMCPGAHEPLLFSSHSEHLYVLSKIRLR